jgi:hypothetical protein
MGRVELAGAARCGDGRWRSSKRRTSLIAQVPIEETPMLILAAALAGSAIATPSRLSFPSMTSPIYRTFADKADKVCPARKLRYLHPADLDGVEEDFLSSLTSRQQHRIASRTESDTGCPQAGASCPAQHTLAAIARARQLDAFVRFACASAI